MQLNKVPKLIRWWFTPKLPKEHIFIPSKRRPVGFLNSVRVYTRKWAVHPIKRRISKYYLLFLQKYFDLTVIGITGSCGKTTVKEMVSSILKQKGETVASFKNIDPIFNIPTSILKCKPGTKFLILEMGIEFPGEMDFYLWLAKPQVGIVTNIFPTHTEFFKNEDGVAKEKVKLVKSLPKDGYAILNQDNPFTKKFGKETKSRVIFYGDKSKIKAEKATFSKNFDLKFTLQINGREINVKLPVLGNQFVSNALAAASTGHALGLTLREIKLGLEGYSMPEHRMTVIKLKTGTILVDDSYNNNPIAAKEALKTFKQIAGTRKKVVVFGDMLELGKHENKFHRELGNRIISEGIDYFIGVGPASKITADRVKKEIKKVYWVKTENDVDKTLKPYLKKNYAVLVKGSRSIGLDKLVSRLSVQFD